MRVGILTFHHVANYGAVLQAYALAGVVRALGHEPEVVDYRPWRATLAYLHMALHTQPLMSELRRMFNTWRFVCRQLPLSSERGRSIRRVARICRRYEALISGSDQIWCWGQGYTFRRYDPTFFLDFAGPGTRRIAYAPSCGGMLSFGEKAAEVSALLMQYDAVSARDENTRQLVEQATGGPCDVVLDPTLVYDFSDFRSPSRLNALPRRYLVACGIFSEEDQRSLKRVSRDLDLAYVSMHYHSSLADRNILSPDPAEWAGVIREATFVVTRLFHGVALALRFGRPFVAVAERCRLLKVRDLLTRMGLASRLVEALNTETVMTLASDFNDLLAAEASLSASRVASLRFLRTALGDG